ncbi:MAG: tetratricopeptide repeat protein, partial [Anaerolineae bacterium]|nr:tetratricopeptide repeat protein [Anaerolineae bacterium]
EIAEEIRRGLDILATEARNVPERQRSMRAVFDYSWNLLQEDERLILRKLSVFRGGWTREAAQEVSAASLRHLTTLVNKSLVRRDAASGRYTLHELLRQYLEARLASDAEAERDARARHAAYFGAWLVARQASLNGAQAKAALSLIQAEMENIIPAFQWTVAQGAFDDIETMQFALVLVAEMTGRFAEGARIFEDAVERLSRRLGGEAAESLTLWRMRLCLYMLAGQGGDRYMSTDPVLEALPLFRKRGADRDVNLALNMLAYAAMLAGDYEAASSRAQEAVALLDRLDDPLLSAITLGNLSYLHFLSGDYGEAERIAVMDMRRADASGSEIQMARVRNMLGEIYHAMNQEEKAKALFEESYALSRALDNRAYLAYVATNLGNVLHRMGRYSESVTRYEESVKLHRDAGNRRGVAEASNMLAGAYLMLGEFRRAIPCHQQALEVFRSLGDVRGVANSLAMLSSAESSEGDYAEAVAHAEECLRLRRQMGNPMDIADVLGHLSRALVFSGDFARAGAVLDEMRTLANSNERLRFPLSSIAAASAVPFYLLQGEFQQVLEATAPYLTALEQYGMTFVLAAMNYSVGRAHLGLGDVDSAVRAYRRSLRAGVESASLMWQAANLAELAVITYAESDPARAVSWVSLALAHGKMAEWTHRHVEALLESLRPRLPVGAFAASVERGQALDLRTVSEGVLQA